MRGIGNKLSVFGLAALMWMAGPGPAAAFPILTVTPGAGDSIDISIENLEEVTGGFASFSISTTPPSTVWATRLGRPSAPSSTTAAASIAVLDRLSMDIASLELSATLAGLQGNPAVGSPVAFVLANIAFNADPDGLLDSFAFSRKQLSDAGTRAHPIRIGGARPASLLLLGGGLAVAVARRRARRQK